MSNYIPRAYKSIQQEAPNQISAYFHLNNIQRIKHALGNKCTSIYHERVPKYELKEGKTGMFKKVLKEVEYFVVAKFEKGIKPLRAKLNGTPDDIKAEYYAQLKNDMSNAARKKGIL